MSHFRFEFDLTAFRFILVSTRIEQNVYLPPQELLNGTLDVIRKLPRDFKQFISPHGYFHEKVTSADFAGVDLQVVYDDSLEFLHQQLQEELGRVIIAFINSRNSNDVLDIFAAHEGVTFFCIPMDDESLLQREDGFPEKIYTFRNPEEFWKLLRENKKKLIQHYRSHFPDNSGEKKSFEQALESQYCEQTSITRLGFAPAQSLECIFDQITGHAWHYDSDGIVLDRNGNRNEALVDPIRLIDDSYKKFSGLASHIQSVSESPRAPLILIVPYAEQNRLTRLKEGFRYYYKTHGDYDIKKEFLKAAYLAETDLDYRLLIQTSELFESKELFQIGQDVVGYFMQMRARHAHYLDLLGYLHASFTFSPVLRTPEIGRSINTYLAPFAPHNFPRMNRKKIYRNIRKFGKQLKNRIFSQKLEKYISNRNGQIVAISDLPVEWMELGGIPLCFYNDVCRIPESTPASIMANYVKSNLVRYSVPVDILKRTLILCGSPSEEHIQLPLKILKEKMSHLNVTVVNCYSLDDMEKAVRKYEPEFLIFLGHGNPEPTTKSSSIFVDNYPVTGEDIIERRISAPLVMLCSCSTSPILGFLNPIYQAFLQVGALSIVSSFLPISVSQSSILLIRILNNLNMARNTNIHSNWLHFISHMMRSSLIVLTWDRVAKKLNFKADFRDDISASLLTELFMRERRPEIFRSWPELMLQAYPEEVRERIKNVLSFDEIEVENFYYTHIGRPDLIFFDVWMKERQNKAMEILERIELES